MARTVVLDTSALMSDPEGIFDAYPGADMVLPLTVVQELDGLKKRLDPAGAAARDVLRRIETATRRLAPVDHRVLNEVDGRGLAGTLKCRELPALLTDLLRVDRTEARGRVDAARNFGTRQV